MKPKPLLLLVLCALVTIVAAVEQKRVCQFLLSLVPYVYHSAFLPSETDPFSYFIIDHEIFRLRDEVAIHEAPTLHSTI